MSRYFSKGSFVLCTSDELKLSEQVKVRFNFPDGHGVALFARVVSVVEGQGYGLRLVPGDDLDWIIKKAKGYAERVERVAKGAGKAQRKKPLSAEENITRRIHEQKAGDAHGGMAPGPTTKSVASAAQTAPPAPPDAGLDTAVHNGIKPPSVQERVGPSEQELIARVSQFDEWLARFQASAPPGATVQAALPQKAHKQSDAQEASPLLDAGHAPPPSIAQSIAKMNSKEKKKLAISGNAAERRVLISDPDKSIHIWVLKNPAITESEIVEYAKAESLSAEALIFLIENPRWGTSPNVALSLVLNPQTPPEAIPNLLLALPDDTLKKLVSTPGIRHLVARQARRLLTERSMGDRSAP